MKSRDSVYFGTRKSGDRGKQDLKINLQDLDRSLSSFIFLVSKGQRHPKRDKAMRGGETQEAVRELHFPRSRWEGEWHKYRDPRPVIPPTCPFQGCTLGKSHHYSAQDFFSLYPAKTDAEAGTAWLLASPHTQTQPSPDHLSHSKCFYLVAKPLRKKILPGYQQP